MSEFKFLPGLATSSITGVLPIANGGNNSSTALSGSSIMVSNGSGIVQGSAGTTTTVLHGNASGVPTYAAVDLTTDVANTLPVAHGGTGKSSATINNLLAGNGTSALTEITTANNSILQTNGSGVPSYSTTLPSAVQSNITTVGTVASGTWNGTTINVAHGGTGKITIGTNSLITGNGTGVMNEVTTANNSILQTNGTGIPSYSTTLPSAVQSNITTVGTIASGTWNGTAVDVVHGGTGKSSATINNLLAGNGTSALTEITTANNSILQTSALGVPSYSTTLPTAVQSNITTVGTLTSGTWNGTAVDVVHGGTGKTSATINNLLAGNGTSALTEITTANNSILQTSALGVPSYSTTLPSAVQSNITTVGVVASGTWNATAVDVAHGGTGKTSATINNLLAGAGTSALTEITTANNSILQTNGSGVPSYSTTLPSAVQSNITTVGTVASGTWNGTALDIAHGGTNQTTYTDGQLLIGNSSGNTLTKATLTPGAGVTITNGNGTITVAASATGFSATEYAVAGTSTYTIPAGAKYLRIMAAGAGGGGGSGLNSGSFPGGSGGGAGLVRCVLIPVDSDTTATVVVGAGGVSGVSNATVTTVTLGSRVITWYAGGNGANSPGTLQIGGGGGSAGSGGSAGNGTTAGVAGSAGGTGQTGFDPAPQVSGLNGATGPNGGNGNAGTSALQNAELTFIGGSGSSGSTANNPGRVGGSSAIGYAGGSVTSGDASHGPGGGGGASGLAPGGNAGTFILAGAAGTKGSGGGGGTGGATSNLGGVGGPGYVHIVPS